MTTQEELDLVVKAKTGDKNAVSMLWEVITPKLYGYLVNTLKDKSLADDILQETWLKAVTSLHKFEPRGIKFSAWLFAIARNECRQHWRRNNHEVVLEEDESETTPDNLIVKENLIDAIFLNELLDKIPEKDQEILRLRFLAEFSFKEIAQILNIPPITARLRVYRALSKARANL